MDDCKYFILNGRVNLFDNNYNTSKLNNNINIDNKYIKGNCVSDIYFSNENLEIVQYGIINSVYNKSNGSYTISRQSDNELIIIMRSIYFQYGKNLNFNINEQIKELNTLVINWSVDEIISNIKQYLDYRKNVSTLPVPLEHAQLPSQKGTKTLEIKSFI